MVLNVTEASNIQALAMHSSRSAFLGEKIGDGILSPEGAPPSA